MDKRTTRRKVEVSSNSTHSMKISPITFSYLAFFVLCSPVALQAEYETKPLSEEQAKAHKLDLKFYKKATEVDSILIATSEKVSDYAHAETAYLFGKMMKSIDAEVAERIRKRRVLCILVGHDELTSQLPQFRSDKKGKELDFYNWRARGFLRWFGQRPVVLFSEEDVMEYEGGMALESILIHEFGHVVHGAGFDEALQKRLTAAFENVKKNGIWNDGRAAQRYRRIKSESPIKLLGALKKSFPNESPELLRKCLNEGDILLNGKKANARVMVNKNDKVLIYFGGPKQCYAAKNRAEYWAEIYQCWFNTNRTMDHDHNHIHTREQLIEYDPVGAKLCEDVLGKSEWRFISPRKRVGQAHLKDYSLNLIKVTDLPHIQKAAYDYYDTYWKEYWQRLYDKHSIKRK